MKKYTYCPMCRSELLTRTMEGQERLVCPDEEGCGFIFYGNPTPVVAAICERDGREVILARNVGWPESWYGLVTGFLEREETPEQGVLREVEEELGVEGEIVSMVGLYPFTMMNQIIIAYHVRIEGEVTLGAELAGVKVVPVEKLRPWPQGTGQAVADWLEQRLDDVDDADAEESS